MHLFVVSALFFAILSYWNAFVCGKSWVESEAIGGAIRSLVWCGAIQSTVGFSSLLIMPLCYLAHAAAPQYFTDVYMKGALNLWYVILILSLFGTGIAIWVESWVVGDRDYNLLNMGPQPWSRFERRYYSFNAIETMGYAFSTVDDALSGILASDEDDLKASLTRIGFLIMIAVVGAAFLGGALITAAIIYRYAGTVPLPARQRAYAR